MRDGRHGRRALLRHVVALLMLLVSLACAGAPHATAAKPTPAAGAREPLLQELLPTLATATTAEAVRAHLTAGMRERERLYIGLDLVTMADCVDGLTAAVLAAREQPDAAAVQHELQSTFDRYVAMRQDAALRLSHGPATCLPLPR